MELQDAIDYLTRVAESTPMRHYSEALFTVIAAADVDHREVEARDAIILRQASTLARIRAARLNHPACDIHPDGDAVTCGWKAAVIDIDKALEGDPS